MQYKVAHNYRSDVGSYDKGAKVEVDDELAEFLERDSPGLLMPIKGAVKVEVSEPEGDAGASLPDGPPASRPRTGSRKR